MATLSVGGTTVFDGATLQAASLTSATFPAGHIIQVKNMTNTECDQSWASTAEYKIPTHCEISISPARTDNKILVLAMCTVGFSAGGAGQWRVQRKTTSGGSYGNPQVLKSHTGVVGDAVGDQNASSPYINVSQVGGIYNQVDEGTTYTQHCSWLDVPNTISEVFYRIELWRDEGTMYLNRPYEATNAERSAGITGITLMEVKD